MPVRLYISTCGSLSSASTSDTSVVVVENSILLRFERVKDCVPSLLVAIIWSPEMESVNDSTDTAVSVKSEF